MKHGRRTSRLYHRIYRHGVLLLLLIAAALGIAGFLLGRDARWHGHPARLAQHAARLIAPLPAEALARELPRLGGELAVELAVFSNDGRRLAATATRELPPLAGQQVARLHAASDTTLHGHGTVSVAAGEGRYLRLSFHKGRGDLLLRALGSLLLVLLVLAAASWPLARAIARPLEGLSNTARRLGAGDLSVRSGLARNDEIGELARAFDEMADRIQRLLTGQRELLANVSHELRTPLARIRVSLGLAAEAEPLRARGYLAEIESDLAELDRLVGDILSTARLDATGGLALRREQIESRTLVEQALQRFGRLAPERRVEATFETAPSLDADPTLLGRVLDNLLDNAAKYSEPTASIRVSLGGADGGVAIAVEDRGIGIDAEDQRRLFTPFFRADRSRTRHTGGVGLGLALCKRIVDAHGGRLSIESRPNEGTAARVWLPAAVA